MHPVILSIDSGNPVILSIDPGKHLIGLAVWAERQLHHVEALKVVSLSGLRERLTSYHPALIVCEVPQIYQHLRGVDQDDLIDVALTAGACLSCAPVTIVVRPHAWKGNVPKPIHNKRVLSKLSALDLKSVMAIGTTLRHNAIDAVGLGQWYLERHPE